MNPTRLVLRLTPKPMAFDAPKLNPDQPHADSSTSVPPETPAVSAGSRQARCPEPQQPAKAEKPSKYFWIQIMLVILVAGQAYQLKLGRERDLQLDRVERAAKRSTQPTHYLVQYTIPFQKQEEGGIVGGSTQGNIILEVRGQIWTDRDMQDLRQIVKQSALPELEKSLPGAVFAQNVLITGMVPFYAPEQP